MVSVTKLSQQLKALRKRDEGASAVEYGLLVAAIAVVIALAVWGLGEALNDQFTESRDCVATADCAGDGDGS